ncbi:Actin cortical patch SUR7/pH-response regulator PalI [Cordyceps fumosorosea ARSEF 2679]|uniref:Actin cortical patch SUR7/pH-response regulator PalI n=1 Tax=Cordyceps fumosorosea (strain ARSEF 2679) TaxID=1081104 RepID=A0A167U9N0_CORFA|nr:Actin cortical patch SUR7/pH-response regulator PalI [Cordyceps fumosorosea ARSEF 2679]OAA61359.1 Actin cortical patch SUR7/pH-response regulator PalI [Cordyceps fumosorosea ARSEF 2679]
MRSFTLRLAAVVSLVLTLISFILAAVTLFAGRDAGTLENYAVLRVNVSMAPKAVLQLGIDQLTGGGQNSLRLRSDDGWLDNLESGLQGFLDDVAKNITNVITQGVDGFVNDAAAEAKRRLNISDWYSLHVLSTCQGEFTPNATVRNPGHHTTSCTGDVRHRFNIAKILDRQFQIGNRNVSLGDLNGTDSVRDQVEGINDNLYALVILLSLAFGLIGAALFSTTGTIAWPTRKSLVLVTLILTALAGTIIAGASIAVTVQTARSIRELNQQTARIGIVASRGGPFLAILWTLMAFTTIVALTWQVLYVLVRRDARRAELVKYSAKNGASRQVAAGSEQLAQREK